MTEILVDEAVQWFAGGLFSGLTIGLASVFVCLFLIIAKKFFM